jgi:hypothetical protein
VTTGDKLGSGTDANVSLTLFGALGDSGVCELKDSETHTNKFEKGHTDIFLVNCLDLGNITKLRIWHDNKGLGSSWYLSRVTVMEEDSHSRFEFPCDQWLSSSEGDNQVLRELLCKEVRGFAR